MKDLELCPVCIEGYLYGHMDINEHYYRGISSKLELHYSICDVCECEITSPIQSRINKQIMISFKESVDGDIL